VDLAVGQAVLLVQPPVVLGILLTIASPYEGIPQQHGEVVAVQARRAQPTFLGGAVRVVSHLRQESRRLDILEEQEITSAQQHWLLEM
jgi:hypothetical protein